jgi:hypothetical protein
VLPEEEVAEEREKSQHVEEEKPGDEHVVPGIYDPQVQRLRSKLVSERQITQFTRQQRRKRCQLALTDICYPIQVHTAVLCISEGYT